jgi:hypothetical protein
MKNVIEIAQLKELLAAILQEANAYTVFKRLID